MVSHVVQRDESHGFTLIEMAVVLAAIAVVIGGVVIAREMIRAAELRQVMSDTSALRTAIFAFREKYAAWPGDFQSATQYWPETADGDGDSVILTDFFGGGESLTFWQQLALGGLIRGQYSGQPLFPPDSSIHEPGINIPAGVLPGSGYAIWDNAGVGFRILPSRPASKFLILGSRQYSANTIWAFVSAALSPADAQSIDAKLDDGIAPTGQVLGFTGSRRDVSPYPADRCSSDVWTPTGTDYNLKVTDPACLMLFVLE